MRTVACLLILLSACGGSAEAPTDGTYDCFLLGGPEGNVLGVLHGTADLTFDDDGVISGSISLGGYENGIVWGKVDKELGFELVADFGLEKVLVRGGRWVPMARLEGPATGFGMTGAFRARHLGFAKGKPSQPPR